MAGLVHRSLQGRDRKGVVPLLPDRTLLQSYPFLPFCTFPRVGAFLFNLI
jgi:hypothetical protein